MAKELIKIASCLVAGVIIAAASGMSGGWPYVLIPLYCLGLFYGLRVVGPWIGKTIASIGKMFMFSVFFKSLLGFLLMLAFLPAALAVLLTVGWFVGMVQLVKSMAELISEQSVLNGQRERLYENNSGRSRRPLWERRPRLPERNDGGGDGWGTQDKSDNDSWAADDDWGSSGKDSDSWSDDEDWSDSRRKRSDDSWTTGGDGWSV